MLIALIYHVLLWVGRICIHIVQRLVPNVQDPSEEPLPYEELRLAAKLRTLCTPRGREKRETLSETADVLFELGKLYLRKAIMARGLLQKLTFIRCCALLNGAKVRYKTLNNRKKVEMVHHFLGTWVSDSIMGQSGAERLGENLFKMSERHLHCIQEARMKEERMLLSLSELAHGNVNQNERIKSECEKINQVKRLTEKATEFYTKLLNSIADDCTNILGKPPCKFALTGVGSLARGEVTLYSDFEHVILLEDGVEYRKDYQQILNYFQWFTTIFQVIVIGFGETIIPSVAVKSLNDYYSQKKSKSWFYDVFTPSGIAFDGMVPHSCCNPLGRQMVTKTRQHTVDLIQPVKEMAKYLTPDEEVKNGYYLKDILSRCCMLYGDLDVYEAFLTKRDSIVQRELPQDIAKELLSKTKSNANSCIKFGTYFQKENVINVKATLYRPIVVFVTYLGRMNGIKSSSSYDVIDALEQKGLMTDDDARRLKLAVALACEIRMKIYAAVRNQRHSITPSKLVDVVGKGTLSELFILKESLKSALEFTLFTTKHEIPVHRHMTLLDPKDLGLNMTMLIYNGRKSEATRLANSVEGKASCKDDPEALSQLFLGYLYVALASDTSALAKPYFTKCKQLTDKNPCEPDRVKRCLEALCEMLEKSPAWWNSKRTDAGEIIHDLSLAIFKQKVDAMMPQDRIALEYFSAPKEEGMTKRSKQLSDRFDAAVQRVDRNNSGKELTNLAKDIADTADEIGVTQSKDLLTSILLVQAGKTCHYADAIETTKVLLDLVADARNIAFDCCVIYNALLILAMQRVLLACDYLQLAPHHKVAWINVPGRQKVFQQD